MSIIKNRILKNNKRLEKLMKKRNVSAYRVYHHDIPEFPYFIDIYNDKVILHDRRRLGIDDSPRKQINYDETILAIEEIFQIKPILKKRREQKRTDKYKRINFGDNFSTIQEGDLKLRVNLFDYIDTGVFLDHRPLRKKLIDESRGKEILNLFSYTCTISAACAFHAKKVISMDLSQKYLDWGIENFKLNNIDPKLHDFRAVDIMEELTSVQKNSFDIIILDPPTFSNSKKMRTTLDVKRDQEFLLSNCMQILKPDGKLYFSTNNLEFRMQFDNPKINIKNITFKTLDDDFKNTKIHQCFELTWKS
jgi:23S rRNA G2069 N7-methylase RlmK/C1962 C5-methylase RlmI